MHTTKQSSIPYPEFIALMALMTSLIALTIDAILPALPEIGAGLNVKHENDLQLLIAFVFFGLSIGQLFYGPLSDSRGRKPAVYLGLLFFFLGSVVCLLSENLFVMLVGRFLQGFGLAGPRSVSMAIVRDQYDGDQMAKVMSFIMAVFIIVPAIAPALGQGIVYLFDWQSIFICFILLAVLIGGWFSLRQPETLTTENKRPFSVANFLSGLKELLTHPVVMGYTIASGFITAPFVAYLSMSQQIFQVQYELHEYFPVVFAALALSIGFASFVNGKLVTRFGMEIMSEYAARVMFIAGIILIPIALLFNGHPPLAIFLLYCLVTLFCVGILFGNLNAMAMMPVGHIAGLGASVIGSVSMLGALPITVLIGKSYDGTVMSMVYGFAVFSFLALMVLHWVKIKHIN